MDLLRKLTYYGLDMIQDVMDDIQQSTLLHHFDVTEKKLEELSLIVNEVNDTFKQSTDRFVVKIPFNFNKQIVESKLVDNVLKIHVEDIDSFNYNNLESHSFLYEYTIPNRLVGGNLTQKYLSDTNELCFIIDRNEYNNINNKNAHGNVDTLINMINETQQEHSQKENKTKSEENKPVEFEILFDDDTKEKSTCDCHKQKDKCHCSCSKHKNNNNKTITCRDLLKCFYKGMSCYQIGKKYNIPEGAVIKLIKSKLDIE